jgi:hypothetical protein
MERMKLLNIPTLPEGLVSFAYMLGGPYAPAFGRAGAYGPPSMYANETSPSGKVGMFNNFIRSIVSCSGQTALRDSVAWIPG